MEVDHQTSRAAPKIQKVFLTLEFDEICNICKSLEKSIFEKWKGRTPPIPKPHPVLPLFLPAAFPLPCPLSQLPLQDWHRHTLDILTPSPWLLPSFCLYAFKVTFTFFALILSFLPLLWLLDILTHSFLLLCLFGDLWLFHDHYHFHFLNSHFHFHYTRFHFLVSLA